MDTHLLRVDGGARGNPGPAGIGAVLEEPDGTTLEEISEGIGWATNNVAEYRALIEGLKRALHHGIRRIQVLADSSLMVQQMMGRFRVKSAGLRPLHIEAKALASQFESIAFAHVPRSENSYADKLVNEGIDSWLEDNPGHTPPSKPQGDLF